MTTLENIPEAATILSSHFSTPPTKWTLKVCLFGGETWWMENFEEKMRMKTFLECV